MLTTLIRDQNDMEAFISDIHSSLLEANHVQVLQAVIADLEILHGQYFDSEADPLGRAWAPLAPVTIERKGHDTKLWETGRLRASLTGSGADSIREVFREDDYHGLVFGSEVPYAIYHITGTSIMPARPEVGISEPVLDAIGERIFDNVMKEITE